MADGGNILLVLSTTRDSPRALKVALEQARSRNCGLRVQFILDTDAPQMVFDVMTDLGFIGDTPSEDLAKAVAREYRMQAEVRLAEVVDRAREQGVRVEATLQPGDYIEECLKASSGGDIDRVILSRSSRSALARRFFGSAVERVRERAGVDVVIVEEAAGDNETTTR